MIFNITILITQGKIGPPVVKRKDLNSFVLRKSRKTFM